MLFALHSSSFDRAFRAAFGRGQRLRAAHQLGNCVMAGIHATLRYNFGVAMSIKVTYKDGVFEPVEEVKGARPGQRYTVFSDEELGEIRETLEWLRAAQKSFEFWNNPADAVYDTL
jgi:hypothetical protein